MPDSQPSKIDIIHAYGYCSKHFEHNPLKRYPPIPENRERIMEWAVEHLSPEDLQRLRNSIRSNRRRSGTKKLSRKSVDLSLHAWSILKKLAENEGDNVTLSDIIELKLEDEYYKVINSKGEKAL